MQPPIQTHSDRNALIPAPRYEQIHQMRSQHARSSARALQHDPGNPFLQRLADEQLVELMRHRFYVPEASTRAKVARHARRPGYTERDF